MSRNTLKMTCTCGNKTAWLIVAKGGYDSIGKSYQPTLYFIQCGNCESEIELRLAQ